MVFRWMPPKKIKKKKSENAQKVLDKLKEYLESSKATGEPIQILCGFWKDQQTVITYQELRQAVIDGAISNETIRLWQQDYSVLVANQLSQLWTNAFEAGAESLFLLNSSKTKKRILSVTVLKKSDYKTDMQTPGALKWIQERGAEFVTASTKEQKDAIAALVTKKMKEHYTSDELAKLIRPCIGLTKQQAIANVRYYDNIVTNLKKEHPRMKPETIRQKARDAAAKYAERQIRYRAMTIAQTESAFAYNRGEYEGIKQAQARGELGRVVKRWSTAGNERVCDICSSLDGVEMEIDADFDFDGKVLFPGHHMLPPAHPRCKCAIQYIEVEPPVIIPRMDTSITQNNSLKEYSDTEIQSIAEQTESVASKYIDVSSKWSGNIIVDDESERHGKMWNCDILTAHETAPHIVLHEQIHARSISYYDEDTYIQYHNIEEATVQLMTQIISLMEGIEIIESQYDEMVDALRRIGRRIGFYNTDYDFAKALIEMPVAERLEWISNNLYATMGLDKNATVEDYIEMSTLLNMLY